MLERINNIGPSGIKDLKAETPRKKKLEAIGKETVGMIREKKGFPHFEKYLREDETSTEKLLKVTAYCLLA